MTGQAREEEEVNQHINRGIIEIIHSTPFTIVWMNILYNYCFQLTGDKQHIVLTTETISRNSLHKTIKKIVHSMFQIEYEACSAHYALH